MYCFSSLDEFAILREIIKAELVRIFGKDALGIFIAINEGVNNAILHGNKENLSKKVYLTMEELPNQIRIVIRDEGKGFINQEISDTTPWSAEHGRGFQLIKHYVDSYEFNGLGNELTLIKKNDIA
ncbi:MAG: putative anti-sigma regulatory factor, serine/threonine protein kinase [Firmicutes bacterium]|nr:putative anti-sigma regulatory factor, serine/threonine protein kinase [Bacillota bacterium]